MAENRSINHLINRCEGQRRIALIRTTLLFLRLTVIPAGKLVKSSGLLTQTVAKCIMIGDDVSQNSISNHQLLY